MECFIIGDIHGELETLKELVKDIDRSKTRIICVGDLIDKGPDSKGVIDFIRSNNIESVKGNHEFMATEMIQYLNSNLHALYDSDWFLNGGQQIYDSYLSKDELLIDLKWLDTLPLYIETDIFDEDGLQLLVSHAYCLHKNLDHIKPFNFVWDREQPTQKKNNSPYYNVYGHTPMHYVNRKQYSKIQGNVIPSPNFYDGCCNLDTGCTYNLRGSGYLSGIYFPSLQIKQVKRK